MWWRPTHRLGVEFLGRNEVNIDKSYRCNLIIAYFVMKLALLSTKIGGVK